jgi:phosphate transport system substrate-binding protein
MKKVFMLLTLAIIALALPLGQISNTYAAEKTTIVIDGSTTVGPIAKAFAEYYMLKNPDVNITVSESGSGNGAKSLINGSCQIATMSRAMKDTEVQAARDKDIKVVAHTIAWDGLAVIVHPSNPVKGLSLQQVKDIYTGKVKNWKDVGGPNKNIIIISRDTNSGTYETFETMVLKGEKIIDGAEYVGSSGPAESQVNRRGDWLCRDGVR